MKLESQEIYNLYKSSIKKSDSIAIKIYAQVYLKKAKNDQVNYRIGYGYAFMAFLNPDDFDLKIKYLDSAINITKNLNNKHFPKRPYLYKGVAYDNIGDFNTALDNYLEGLKYALKYNDEFNINIFSHNIALLKRKLGKYEEAKILLKNCLNYRAGNLYKSKNDTISYLGALGELVTVYRRNKEIDSANILNSKGLKMSKNMPNNCLFQLNLGILQYHKGKYKNAIFNLKEALRAFSDPNNKYFSDNFYFIDTYMFLAKSYEEINNEEQAIINYKKIDSLVNQTNYLIPETRTAYEKIIKYYKLKNDQKNQLFYINKLLYNDSILDFRFKELNSKIIKSYDTPILLSEKERLIVELQTKNNKSYYILLVSIGVITVIVMFLIFHYYKHQQYRVKFEELINNNEKKTDLEKIKTDTSIGVAEEIVEIILQSLSKFENTNGFRKKNLTSSILASKLNTNMKYLTKVIKFHKQKSFTQYINDLRIEYIINRLKEDKKIQKYTIKALAEEAGFNSAEVFSKSFFKKTGIYPSYFIKKIQNTNV